MTINTQRIPTYTSFDPLKVKYYEHTLEDVMELIDNTLLINKLQEVEADMITTPNELNKVRLGIIYHEVALNLCWFSKTTYKGYAKKSYDLLSVLAICENTQKELLPFICCYRASALALVGAESKKLNLIYQSFDLFKQAVKHYAKVSYLPEFLRASVAENLPWFFFKQKKFAKADFESIIEKQNKDQNYANWKIMSFTYWAWANQRPQKKYRTKALVYLHKAIELDPNYQAARQRAEQLQKKWKK